MNKDKSHSRSKQELDLSELETQIALFTKRVELHARRGRLSGTYDHVRLLELEQKLEELLDNSTNVREELDNG